MNRTVIFAAVLLPLATAACSRGGSGDGPGYSGARVARAPLVLSSGTAPLSPAARGAWADGVDLARLGIRPDEVTAWYDLTTPAGASFQIDVVSRRPGNSGDVLVGLAHASDDGNTPEGGPESVAAAGIVPAASGVAANALWLDARGDGFGCISLRGAVRRDQVLAFRAKGGAEPSVALVRIGIGPESAINVAGSTAGDYPGIRESRTLYSSNSWMFGLPTAAVSGDRTTIVAYEGDRSDPGGPARYEMRLQSDNATGTVTGGAAEEASPDSGYWRDHEVTALYNVLALVHSGTEAVTLRLSYDRGATFGQVETLDRGSGGWYPRLAQIAMAADYTVGVAYWKSTGGESEEDARTTDLVLVQGRPSSYDPGGSPSKFAFDAPRTLRSVEGDVTPLLTGIAWSGGGDLVVGYGYTSFRTNPDLTWTSVTQDRCAVIPWGGELRDTLVEENEVVGKDPSVAVLGRGDVLRILYAYEAADGVRVKVSDDAGKTFRAAEGPGDRTASVPTILARDRGGVARVDLLYMAEGEQGSELHLMHWDDFDAGGPTRSRLTRAIRTDSADAPAGEPTPGASDFMIAPDYGFRTTQVAWFGYDAVVDGEDVVVVYDEVTYDAVILFGGVLTMDGDRVVTIASAQGEFMPADPPPLAPGLTEPVPAPDPAHMHQLKLLRLE
jgi:hypothetical protein